MTSVSTLGWDLVFAVRLNEINAHIAARQLPARKVEKALDDLNVVATLDGWHIVPGGAGDVIYIALNLREGEVQRDGHCLRHFSGKIVVSAKLKTVNARLDDETSVVLQIAQDDRPGFLGSLVVEHLDLSGLDDAISQGIVRAALQEWLDDSHEVVEHVFAVTGLCDGLDQQPFSFLRPTSLSYAYVDTHFGDGILALLAMVDGRSPERLDRQVSANALASDSDAAILISPHLLLDGIIRAAFSARFPGLPPQDLVLQQDRPKMLLKHPAKINPIKVEERLLDQILSFLSIEFRATSFICESENEVVLENGSKVFTRTTTEHKLEVTRTVTGETALEFVDVGPAIVSHRTEIDPHSAKIAEYAGDVILVASIVAAAFTGGVLGVLIGLTGTLYSGLLEHAEEFASTYANANIAPLVPSIDLLALNVALPYRWADDRAFQAADVDLVESLRLSGRLVAAEPA